MSTRAYRIITLKTEDEPTFNITHQYKMLEEAGAHIEENVLFIERATLERILNDKDLREKYDMQSDDDWCIQAIKKDLASIGEDGEYVQYYLI